MQRAIDLAQKGMDTNSGGPFGAVVVKDDIIIAEGYNKVTSVARPGEFAMSANRLIIQRRAFDLVRALSLVPN